MGLGKTIQAITLMVLRQSDDAVIRTNLVIVCVQPIPAL